MNRFLTALFAAILAASLLAACDNAPQSVTNVVGTSATASTNNTSWPPPARADMPVAANLMADNWVFVMDASGSMDSSSCGTKGEPRMETAKAGAIKFGRSLPATANLGLVVFSARGRDEIAEWLKLDAGPANRAEFVKQVGGIQPRGNTPLYAATKLGVQILTEQAQRQRGYGTYHLVIVTDGDYNAGGDPSPYVIKVVKQTAIVIHTIGFCVDGRHSLDIKGYTQYASANNPETLDRGLQAILAESEAYTDSQFTSQ